MGRFAQAFAPTLLLAASLAAAPGERKITGVVTDAMCPTGDHSRMRMGPTDAECTKECVDGHGTAYALYDGKRSWTLIDLPTPEKFAGRKVKVTGSVDLAAKAIRVVSAAPAR